MSKVLVFGHKNPDNDAIMSSVVLAQLLNQVEYMGNTYEARRLGPLPAETEKLLAETNTPKPRMLNAIKATATPQKIVLTDHNEPGQSVDGLENAEIIGVVDHHRFGDFTTAAPLHIMALPWGSSCTIVSWLFGIFGQKPTDDQAKLLLAAMMTDTLMLKSPTTTEFDRIFAQQHGEQLGVDPVKFGMDVFMSRPSGSFTPDEMVGNDIKLFEVGGKKLLIGQYETVDKSRALGMIPEIRKAMADYQKKQKADGIVLCITDIMEEGSQVLFEGDTALAQKGLGVKDAPEGVWMPGVLSRKKQVAAPIMAVK